MTIQDTYKYGSLCVDAALTVERLRDGDLLTGEREQVLERLLESPVDFQFDEDWEHGSIYQGSDAQETPLVLLGQFGGYPGESLDEANSEAAAEWAQDRDYIYSYSTWFGGCRTVNLYLNMDDATLEEAEEAIELAEGYQDYPVLDEDLWSQKQSEAWDEMFDEMKVDEENKRDIEFTEEQGEALYEMAQSFYGYWDEGYFAQDEWDKIVEEVLAEEPGTMVQLHQEDKLF